MTAANVEVREVTAQSNRPSAYSNNPDHSLSVAVVKPGAMSADNSMRMIAVSEHN
jgi:hypothetical protein